MCLVALLLCVAWRAAAAACSSTLLDNPHLHCAAKCEAAPVLNVNASRQNLSAVCVGTSAMGPWLQRSNLQHTNTRDAPPSKLQRCSP